MDDQSGGEWPAAVRLGLDLGELALGHAGIMFERHRRDAISAAPLKIEVAHEADKTRDAAHGMVAGGELFQLMPDIQILALHPDHRLSPRSPAGRSRSRRFRAPGARTRHNPG